MEEFIAIYNNNDTKELSNLLLKGLLQCGTWKKALVYGEPDSNGNIQAVASNTRTCSSLPKLDSSYEKMCDESELIFSNYVNSYAQRHNVSLSNSNEKYSYGFVKYQTGEYYSNHSDDAGSQIRKISTTLYLNEDYSGGEIFFDKINFLYKPKMGDLIIFPSSFPFSHEAKPVIAGTKYCVIKFWS